MIGSDWLGRPGQRGQSGSTVIRTLALLGLLLRPAPAGGQAWVTPPGEGTVSLFHQFVRSDEHLNRVGEGTRALGSESFHVVFLEASYGLSDRIAVDGSATWLATKWTGAIDDRHGPLDTGIYHNSFQDARVAVRYQLVSRPVSIAPFISAGTPTHAYETRGHSAFGRGLRELQLGLSAGRDWRGLFRGGYLHGAASYTFSERVDLIELDLDHINGDFEAGVALHQRISLRGFGNWQVMRDGLQLGPLTEHFELSPIHDRLARASYLQLGGATTIALTPSLDASVSGFATASGRNTHAVKAIVSGLTWKFGGHFKISAPADAP